MRRTTFMVAAATSIVLGGALALAGASTAQAVPAGHWGTFTVDGTSGSYSGTVQLAGFPATTYVSTARGAQVANGTGTWQGPASQPGQIYGSSRNQPYLTQGLSTGAITRAVTTYTFADATPATGWSFVLGDIDADQVTVSGTETDGDPVPISAFGFQGAYNSCSSVSPGGWSCPATTVDPTPGSDVPRWDPDTGVLVGNPSAADTSGATGWFSPNVPLRSLTLTYDKRSGGPSYQTWFADRTAALSGQATTDGSAYPGAEVTATSPNGQVFRTTTGPDGSYIFPALIQQGGYQVEITRPSGTTGPNSVTAAVAEGDATGVDFAFVTPVVVSGAVRTDGTPTEGATVQLVDSSGAVVATTSTGPDGSYSFDAQPRQEYTVRVEVPSGTEGVSARAVDARNGNVTGVDFAFVSPATISGSVTLDGAPVSGIDVDLRDASGAVVATTSTEPDGTYSFAGLSRGEYTVRVSVPDGATGSDEQPVDAIGGSVDGVDFAFEAPISSVDQPGTVTDSAGQPVAGQQVVATPSDPADGDAVTTQTGTDGTFDLTGLKPSTEYSVATNGSETQLVTTPATGSGQPLSFVVTAGSTPTPTPTPTPPGATPPGVTPVGDGGSASSGPLAFTGSDPVPALLGGGLLLAAGIVFLVARAVRGRRNRDHLQD